MLERVATETYTDGYMTWRLERERVIARKNKDSGNLNAILFKCYQVILVSLFISSLSNGFSIGEEGNPETISLHFFSFFKRQKSGHRWNEAGADQSHSQLHGPQIRPLRERPKGESPVWYSFCAFINN